LVREYRQDYYGKGMTVSGDTREGLSFPH